MSATETDDRTLATLVTALVLMPFDLAFFGWQRSLVWSWFIVPLGVRPLSIVEAVGLAVAWSVIKNGKDDRKETPGEFASRWLESVVRGLVGLGIAWVVMRLTR
jgi:hypothetical protein